MEKEKVNDEKPDPQNSLDFSEHFNQLELLETHGHLIPTGTQSLWIETYQLPKVSKPL